MLSLIPIVIMVILMVVAAFYSNARAKKQTEYHRQLLHQEFAARVELQCRLNDTHAKLLTARRGLNAVTDLIGSSNYVGGLHLSGEIAPWQDLREGGDYEEWLIEFDKALKDMPSEPKITKE